MREANASATRRYCSATAQARPTGQPRARVQDGDDEGGVFGALAANDAGLGMLATEG